MLSGLEKEVNRFEGGGVLFIVSADSFVPVISTYFCTRVSRNAFRGELSSSNSLILSISSRHTSWFWLSMIIVRVTTVNFVRYGYKLVNLLLTAILDYFDQINFDFIKDIPKAVLQ